MYRLKRYWFTLVELIVVISILAILSTIAFISFQWYTSETRDVKRKTDIATILKWLQLYYSKYDEVPEPSETKTTISYSGSQLITQWYAWESVLTQINTYDAKDPVDEQYYTYSVNQDNTKFQVVWFLENEESNFNASKSNTFANYSKRVVYSAGQNVWVLLGENQVPVQQLWNNVIELNSETTVYTTILNSNKILSDSWAILKKKILWWQDNLFWWRAYDSNCPVEDIVIWNQTWAGCNSTLWTGHEWGDYDIIDENNGTHCMNYDGGINYTNWVCGKDKPRMKSNANPRDFFDLVNAPWALKEFDTIWWKFYNFEESASACPIWRHIPKADEFEQLLTFLNGGESCVDTGCTWLWWKARLTNTDNFVEALKIPASWLMREAYFTRRWRFSRLLSVWNNNDYHYWATPVWGDWVFKSVSYDPDDYSWSYGAIRCLKD